MKSLFRSLEEKRREESIKLNLMNELKRAAEELVNEHREEGVIRSTEVSNTLLSNLESIFIHGLKETLLGKFSSVMAGPDQMPEPEFWSLVLVFSHRDIIQQVHRLSQITTDIGRCRAWIRLVLNDALLPSYIESISVQNNALGPYYKKTAFLRDPSMLANLQKEVNTFSNISFEFPTNSCLLNYWTTQPLLMAGIWTPPIKLSAAVDPERMDVASDIAAELPDTIERMPVPNPYLPMEQVLYNEDEALKIILGTPVQDSLLKDIQSEQVNKNVETSECSTQIEDNDELLNKATEEQLDEIQPIDSDQQNNLKTLIEDSQFPVEELSETIIPKLENDKAKEKESSPKRKESTESVNFESFDVLLKKYNANPDKPTGFSSSPSDRQNNLENILQTYDLMSDALPSLSVNPIDQMSGSFIIEQELKGMVDHLGKFMSESGLISQNFMCKRCKQHIGISFVTPKVCGLTGQYYCAECFDERESVIPARILHNWDFSKYAVSKKAFDFLEDVQAHPLLNIRSINPRLYFIVPEMEDLQKKRMKLNLLRMYIMTCREPVVETLKKQLWPREYLYEHIHLYSISDLIEIPSSSLQQTLSQVIKFCEYHVINCQLCSQKGYICEVCNSQQIIYPFHLETTYRCPKCSLVIHLECKSHIQECPKCSRIEKRTL